MCLPGSTRALPVINSESFPYAMTEPVKVIAPINTPRNISISWIIISTLDKF